MRTSPSLVAFRDWIVEQATASSGRCVINATGAGILQGGSIRQRTLTAVIEGLAELPDPRAALAEAHAASRRVVPLRAALQRTLSTAAEREALLRRWTAFTAGTVSEADIVQRLTATLSRLDCSGPGSC